MCRDSNCRFFHMLFLHSNDPIITNFPFTTQPHILNALILIYLYFDNLFTPFQAIFSSEGTMTISEHKLFPILLSLCPDNCL